MRSIRFDPCSRISDFLGTGYTSHGLAQATLADLLPIYPLNSLHVLAQLQRYSSDRDKRAGDKPELDVDAAFVVVMFKNFTPEFPSGLTVDAFAKFFTDLFTYQTSEERDASYTSTQALLNHPLYTVLAITVPTFVSNDSSQLMHVIIGAALYMFDRKHGSFVNLVGVTDAGDPSVCTLSNKFFVDSSDSGVLLQTSSFRGHGLASFLLSSIQVLGHLTYKAPSNPPTSTAQISCNEDDDIVNLRHHLYLQARVEMGSAYVMYAKMGFTTNAIENGPFRCFSYREQCPVLLSRMNQDATAGYITDDHLLRLLVLKKWLYNVYPPDSTKTSLVDSATNMWNSPGLSLYEFLSSPIIPPRNNPNTRAFTNSAYLQLLKCRTNVGKKPLQFYVSTGETSLVPLPVDRTVSSITRAGPGKLMISGYQLEPSDIRRSLFRSLVAYIGDKPKFDAFQAIAAALYTEGKFVTTDDDLYSHPEMSLELRLNVIAFYQRCARFPFTSPLLEYWSTLAIEEYEYAVANDLVASLGLSDFNGDLVPFTETRL
jgi:hypothetical protein